MDIHDIKMYVCLSIISLMVIFMTTNKIDSVTPYVFFHDDQLKNNTVTPYVFFHDDQ